jgi:CII-binding regulator of phage lambda lysogenization HflD
MTDMPLLTLVITLLAIFGAMYNNRKGTEDMRDVLRAEFRSSVIEVKADLSAIVMRIENKLDHYAETQATHSEQISRLEKR